MFYNENGLYNVKELGNRIHERILDSKKIAKATHRIEDIEYVLDLINNINQLSYYEKSYKNVRLEDIRIPKCFASFVWPERVSLRPELKYTDLRLKCSDLSEVEIDLQRLQRLMDALNSEFKANETPVNILDCRSAGDLNSVNYCVLIGDEYMVVSEDNNYYVSYPVIPQVAEVVGSHVFNESAEYLMNLLLNNMKFTS